MEGHGKDFESSFGSITRELLSGKKNIMVLVGAGISVSCGIPDFRSSQGLYNTLRCEEIDKDLAAAEDLFHLDFFEENPAPFYKFAVLNNLFAPRKPSTSHFFLKLLEEQSKLLRVYTQNIDGLEEFAGGELQSKESMRRLETSNRSSPNSSHVFS
jgi:NAD-dependent SIR2 family protein deacetylase